MSAPVASAPVAQAVVATPAQVVPAAAPAVAPAAPAAARPAAAKKAAPEKRKLTPVERFRIWIGRPLVAVMAFASLFVVGAPVLAATYTRESASPLAWRNLTPYEVQGKVEYCFKKPSFTSVFGCDYTHVSETGGLSPRKGRIKRTTILKPYPVAGPIIFDAPMAGRGAAPGPVAAAPGAPAPAPTQATGGGGAPAVNPTPTPKPAPTPTPVTTYPVLTFPAGPMPAIEAACERYKAAAQAKSLAYQLNVERQCEAAKQAYERAHP